VTTDIDGGEPALRRHLHVLRQRKWLVAQALVVGALGAVLVTLRQQPQYRATASVLLRGVETGGATAASPEREAQTAADLASMPIVVQAALQRVPQARMTIASFLAHAHAAPRPDSDILDFRVTDPIPQRAVALATAYARSFIAVREAIQRRTDNAALQRAATSSGAAARRVAAVAPDLAGTVLVRKARAATRVEPRPVRNIAVGLLLGLFAGIGLAYVREMLNTHVRDVGEVTSLLRLPLLGVARGESQRGRHELVLQSEPIGRNAESFRILRANVEFANVDRHAQVLLAAGAADGEGRSTTIANLGLAFALAGRNVIVADLDLRHPSLHRLFGVEGRCGLSDVALGHVPLEAALAPIPLRPVLEAGASAGSLRVLPSGPTPTESGEFVASRAVQTLLTDLREHADLILLDAPPLLRVGDALTLSTVADALLVVVNVELATRSMLHELRRVLDACPTPRLGLVATGVARVRGEPYGGYYAAPEPVIERVA
jgi:succinoglycan biosynthesis transport protein ExoP